MLRQLFGTIRPYVNTQDATLFATEFNKASKLLAEYYFAISKPSKNVIASALDSALQKATDALYQAARFMLLPVKGNEATEYSTQEFFRGS